jgi:hypothetical protein
MAAQRHAGLKLRDNESKLAANSTLNSADGQLDKFILPGISAEQFYESPSEKVDSTVTAGSLHIFFSAKIDEKLN